MSHSFNKLWIHAVWSTKDRMPLISSEIENKIYDQIKLKFMECDCTILGVNGMPDHIHCLFLLNPKRPLTEIIKYVKGSTSHFINKENIIHDKFSWQTGYAAFSVSESVMKKVLEYIQNQKIHHQKKSFQLEFNEFLKLHELENH